MSVRREITRARRLLLDARSNIDELLTRMPERDMTKEIPINPTGALDVLEDLLRRGAQLIADGFPPGSTGAGGRGGGADSSTSTERASLRLAAPADSVEPDTWQEERDLAADVLRELVSDIERAAFHMGDADLARKLLLSIQGRRHGRESTVVNCPLCTRLVTNMGDDRIRSGYCRSCYDAWRAAGSPRDPVERHQFEREWLAKLEERKAIAPAAGPCPQGHLCCDEATRAAATHTHWPLEAATCRGCAAVRGAQRVG